MENVHYGQMSAVNLAKEEFVSVGQDYEPVYFRSAAKPFQAIPIFMTDFIEKYEITSTESALFLASQRGEIYHQEALTSLLEKIPVCENDLICAASYPLNEEPKTLYIQQGFQKRKLLHNCAGKHLGFITMCRELGFPVEGYWEESHPLQQSILKILSELSCVPQSEIRIGTDGCGVPVFAIPLKNMAITYLKLACPDLVEDEKLQKAIKKMTRVMNDHSRIVASDDFICSILLKDYNIVAKGGAQGVYCFGLKKERIGFALKVFSGSENVWPNIIASILEQIDYPNKETITNIRKINPSIVKNDSGTDVGEIIEVFSLK